MNGITCGGCNRVFAGRVLPEHNCDGSAFGELGQDPEKFEKDRLSGLPMTPQFDRQNDIAAMAAGRGPARGRALQGRTPESLNNLNASTRAPHLERAYPQRTTEEEDIDALERSRPPVPAAAPAPNMDVATRQEVAGVMAPMIREAFGELATFLSGLKSDIQEQNDLLKHIDAPMEAVVDSHERAASSFETLRRDILDGGMSKLEKVLDTAGLSEQASKAERRLEELVQRIDAKIDAAFKSHAADMVSILHLLERLQARELRETKHRIERASRSAVRRGPKV